MADWANIADTEIDVGSPVTETLMGKYRDRDDFLLEVSETLSWITYALSPMN